MKGYLVDYITCYKDGTKKIFVPAANYVSFLICLEDRSAEVTAAVLTEYPGENIPVADSESFGWVAKLGDINNGKTIFIPEEHLNDVANKIRLNGSQLSLLHWTNKIVFDIDLGEM